jgi:uncharacterized protein DUF1501
MFTRRDFLRAGSAAAGVATFSSIAYATEPARRAKSCIALMLVGGPSQLETWDPKPDAPIEIRGPFRSIATRTTGVRISEHLPRLASRSDRYAILRTVHHDAPPIHEAGLQLLQTGRLSASGDPPHFGAALGVNLLPSPLGNMGLNLPTGQNGATRIESQFTHRLTASERDRYGKTAFGDACARSRQLVEGGTRCVVVNMFDAVNDRVTWDCHADRYSLASTLADYRRTLCPILDHALSALLDDLQERGLLAETLVVAMGEMGRSPRVNASGGRDHWTRCWSIVMAGGGVLGGRVIGVSDQHAAEPIRRPVGCTEVLASIRHALGLPDPHRTSIVKSAPIRELFC